MGRTALPSESSGECGAFARTSAGTEALLEVVNASIGLLLRADSILSSLSEAVGSVADVIQIDRMIVFETRRLPDDSWQRSILHIWKIENGPKEDPGAILFSEQARAVLKEWQRPLYLGSPIFASRRSSDVALQQVLVELGVMSVLVIPVFVSGNYWGHIAFESCRNERDWTPGEIDALKILAEVIGITVTRERYIDELSKANTIVQNSPTILFRLRAEPAFPMIYVSQNIALLGIDRSAMLAAPCSYQTLVHEADRALVQATLVNLLRNDSSPSTIEYRMLTACGQSRWIENRYSPVRDPSGHLIEVEGIMIDITDRKLAEEHITQLARTDALTQLANRATFHDRLRQAFAAARRGSAPFAVMYLDLDYFKAVNDRCGHSVGDTLLQQVAERLLGLVRTTDLVARVGGDEFAVIQTRIEDLAQAGALAQTIVETLSEPYLVGEQTLRIGASVGISVYCEKSECSESLLTQADQALYRAKEDGRGRYRFHSEDLDRAAHEMLTLASDLRDAMAKRQLELYYQPQVDLTSGRIIGMEALIRWNHPTRGLLSPDSFLEAAEKAGMGGAIARWLLDGACRQLAEWRAAGMDVPLVAVNVAMAQVLSDKDFLHDVKNSLRRWKLQPGDLELDVTEFILAQVTLARSSVLEELSRLGVCIAIDDFGAQYSSLDYLRTYHVNCLKISRPAVAAATRPAGQTMLRAIIGLAAELGIEVVAEGVETAEQRAALIDISSQTKGQGFYFGPPLSAEDTSRLLSTTAQHRATSCESSLKLAAPLSPASASPPRLPPL